MDFGEVLTRAWNIIWKNKALWIFGLLASLAGGSGRAPGGQMNYNFNDDDFSRSFPQVERFFEQIPVWVPILIALFGLVLALAFLFLGALGRAGLARGAWLADSGESTLSFSRIYNEATPYYIRSLLLTLLLIAVSIGIFLLIFIPGILGTIVTLGIGIICLLPLICLLVPLFIVLSVVFELANAAIVGEDLGVMDAVRRAWEVFRANLGQIIGIGLIIVIITAVANFIVSLPLLLVAVPFAFSMMSGSENAALNAMPVAVALFCLYLPVLLAASALIQSYVGTAWTVTFRRLTGRLAGGEPAAVVEAAV